MKRHLHHLLIIVTLCFAKSAVGQAPYCAGTSTSGCGLGFMDRVQFAGQIDNTPAGTGCAGDYNLYAASATVDAGLGYPICITTQAVGNVHITVWIDFDASNSFEPSEIVFTVVNQSGAAPFNGTINIPSGATGGATRMRVRSTWNQAITGPCVNVGRGETEDYPITINAVFIPPSSKTVFETAYGGALDDVFYAVEQTTDGGYIMCGETRSFGAGGADVYLVKIDTNGAIEWESVFGGTNGDYGRSVQQTSDGGYIIGAYTLSFTGNHNFYLIKTNALGTMTWAKTYGDNNNEYLEDVKQTSDGGYIMVGQQHMTGTTFDMYVVKTDGSGNFTWAKAYGTGSGGGSPGQKAYQVMEVAGNYVLAGSTSDKGPQTGQSSFYLTNLTSTGTIVWSKVYQKSGGSTNQEDCYSADVTADGGFILSGRAAGFTGGGGTEILNIKTDGNGIIQWAKTYGGAGTDYAWGIENTSDGGYVMGGQTTSFGTGTTWYMVKTDVNGTLSWSRAYTGSANDACYDITEVSSYIMGGRTTSFGSGIKDAFVIKTDDNGNSVGGVLGCNQLSTATTVEATQTANITTMDISTVGAGSTRTFITNSSSSAGATVTGTTSANYAPGSIATDACLLLSLDLLSFEGKPNSSSNRISWSVLTTKANKILALEKSTDQFNWSKVESEYDYRDNGNTTSFQQIDNRPAQQTYYRLAFKNDNGDVNWSRAIKVNNYRHSAGSIQLYPNPSLSYFTINVTGMEEREKIEIEIFDSRGQLARDATITNGQNYVHNLSKGLYLLKLKGQNEVEFNKLIIN